MKKIMLIGILMTTTLVSFVGCGNTSKDDKANIKMEEPSKKDEEISKDLKSIRSEKDEEVFQEMISKLEKVFTDSFGKACSSINIREQENHLVAVLTPMRGFVEEAKADKKGYDDVKKNMTNCSKLSKELVKATGFQHEFMVLLINDQNPSEYLLSVVNGGEPIDNLDK